MRLLQNTWRLVPKSAAKSPGGVGGGGGLTYILQRLDPLLGTSGYSLRLPNAPFAKHLAFGSQECSKEGGKRGEPDIHSAAFGPTAGHRQGWQCPPCLRVCFSAVVVLPFHSAMQPSNSDLLAQGCCRYQSCTEELLPVVQCSPLILIC